MYLGHKVGESSVTPRLLSGALYVREHVGLFTLPCDKSISIAGGKFSVRANGGSGDGARGGNGKWLIGADREE